jgi:hypothetical protein
MKVTVMLRFVSPSVPIHLLILIRPRFSWVSRAAKILQFTLMYADSFATLEVGFYGSQLQTLADFVMKPRHLLTVHSAPFDLSTSRVFRAFWTLGKM